MHIVACMTEIKLLPRDMKVQMLHLQEPDGK